MLTLIVATQVGGRNREGLQIAVAAAGGFAAVGGGIGLYSTTGKKDSLKLHISKVEAMKNGWENYSTRFKQSKNK